MPISINYKSVNFPLSEDQYTEVFNGVIRVMRRIFSFTPIYIKVWRLNAVDDVLLENSMKFEELSSKVSLNTLLASLRKGMDVTVEGVIAQPKETSITIEFFGNLEEKKYYPDITVETGAMDTESIVELLWKLEGSIRKTLLLNLVRDLEDITIEGPSGKKIRMILEVFIAPNIVSYEDMGNEDLMLYYNSKGKEDVFIYKLLEANKKVKLDDAKRLRFYSLKTLTPDIIQLEGVRKIMEEHQQDIEAIDVGSYAFISKKREGFKNLVSDLDINVISEIVDSLPDSREILKDIKKRVNQKKGIGNEELPRG